MTDKQPVTAPRGRAIIAPRPTPGTCGLPRTRHAHAAVPLVTVVLATVRFQRGNSAASGVSPRPLVFSRYGQFSVTFVRKDRGVTNKDPDLIVPAGYTELLAEIKAEVLAGRVRAARAVHTEVIELYWRIGRLLLDRQSQEEWGSRTVQRLSEDLRAEFPGMRGLAPRNLAYMRSFAQAWPDPVLQHDAAKLPWGHIMVLIDRIDDQTSRDWYARQDAQHGWSRAVLEHHIKSGRHLRVGAAPNNFPDMLTAAESEQTLEILQDPYDLDFLALDPNHNERDLEEALVARLTHFLAELGSGFAFVGRQYKLSVGSSDYFIDLLFYHLGLRRFIVFELKAVAAQPEHVGKLNFYVNVVDDLLRRPEHGDGSTIGILLAADRDDIAVQYSLRGLTTPLAISTYTNYRALPDEVRPALPSAADLAEVVRDVRRNRNQDESGRLPDSRPADQI